ncbi:hypothetical protein CTA2_453 [Colletotrichum tanaceti]|uniref:Uncharacterized protein n=1 Tax=Colletotrichum tanaceti TaxID=1306861 RepID=A0A4U6XAK1_9PEZI|nr:hypothetical protein CTA2_453 [Colletotrichum tanaceti]TKW52545.1 hypothetical protein CTA1_13426 [Colletotrichum tanaceti]
MGAPSGDSGLLQFPIAWYSVSIPVAIYSERIITIVSGQIIFQTLRSQWDLIQCTSGHPTASLLVHHSTIDASRRLTASRREGTELPDAHTRRGRHLSLKTEAGPRHAREQVDDIANG